MGPGWRSRRGLAVTLAVLVTGIGLGACGGSTVATTSSANVLRQTRQRLERAITRDARRSANQYWKGRFRFGIETKCRSMTVDGGNWACRTTVRSSQPMTATCRIRTKVHATESAFHFKAPLPFARNVFSEGCPTLHSELASS